MCRSRNGVVVYSAEAGVESESKISDSVHLCEEEVKFFHFSSKVQTQYCFQIFLERLVELLQIWALLPSIIVMWCDVFLSRNTDRAILGDQNGRANLVNVFIVRAVKFYLTGEVLRVLFLECCLCRFGTNSAAPIVTLICRWMIYSTPRVNSFCACSTSLSHSSILYSNIRTVCGTVCCVFRYSFSNKVHCIFVKGAPSFWGSVKEKHNSLLATVLE